MQRTRLVLNGALALSALLLVASCKSAGSGPVTLIEPTIVEVPVRQLVDLDPALLEVAPLAPLPTPAFRDSGPCATGCYSGRQMDAALDTALDGYEALANQIREIAKVYADAKAKPPKP